MVMDIKKLTYFLAVAQELHFGRAATRLNMAQPPLSRAIIALEEEIGVTVFDRSRSQIKLTPAGVALQDHAVQILARLDTALRDVRAVGQGGAGRLRLAFVGSASHGLLPILIKSFRSFYPQVELVISTMNNADLHRALISRDIDIAVARPELRDVELRSEVLGREKLVLALPDNTPLASKSEIALQDLADQTFVLYPRRPRPSYVDTVLSICQHEGFSPAKLELTQDFQSAMSLVSVGVGVSVVPQSVASATRPGVIFRPYQGYNPGTALTIHARLDNRLPQVMNFFDIMQKFTKRYRDA